MSKLYTAPPGLFGSLEEDYQQQLITSEEELIGSRERSQKLSSWGGTAKFGSAQAAPRSAAGPRKAFQGPTLSCWGSRCKIQGNSPAEPVSRMNSVKRDRFYSPAFSHRIAGTPRGDSPFWTWLLFVSRLATRGLDFLTLWRTPSLSHENK